VHDRLPILCASSRARHGRLMMTVAECLRLSQHCALYGARLHAGQRRRAIHSAIVERFGVRDPRLVPDN